MEKNWIIALILAMLYGCLGLPEVSAKANSMDTFNSWLYVGDTRSGKTHHAKQMVTNLVSRVPYVVFLNTTKQLSEHYDSKGGLIWKANHVFITQDSIAKYTDTEGLYRFIRASRMVHFEVSAVNPKEFVRALSLAIKKFGQLETQTPRILFVIDEAHMFLSKRFQTLEMLSLWTEGLKFGIMPLVITQQIAGSHQDIIADTISRMARQLLVFSTSDVNSRKRLKDLAQGLPDPINFLPPSKLGDKRAEYGVYDRTANSGYIAKRDLSNSRGMIYSRFGRWL